MFYWNFQYSRRYRENEFSKVAKCPTLILATARHENKVHDDKTYFQIVTPEMALFTLKNRLEMMRCMKLVKNFKFDVFYIFSTPYEGEDAEQTEQRCLSYLFNSDFFWA